MCTGSVKLKNKAMGKNSGDNCDGPDVLFIQVWPLGSLDDCKSTSQVHNWKTCRELGSLDVPNTWPAFSLNDVLPWFCGGSLWQWVDRKFWHDAS